VSSLGRVKSLKRFGRKSDKILTSHLNSTGYPTVTLTVYGRCKKVKIHQLVASVFIEPRPKGLEVNHKNGFKNDNHLNNLEYVTHRENMQHASDTLKKMGLVKGEANGRSKLTKPQVLEIRKLAPKYSQRQLGRLFNVSHRAIGDIINRKCWKHV